MKIVQSQDILSWKDVLISGIYGLLILSSWLLIFIAQIVIYKRISEIFVEQIVFINWGRAFLWKVFLKR